MPVKKKKSAGGPDFKSLGALERVKSTKELVAALARAQEMLEATDQEDARPAGLKAFARSLVSPALAEHGASAVRAWTATCACEVLRIYAPSAPYGDGELLGVFALLANTFRAAGAARAGAEAELVVKRVARGRRVRPSCRNRARARARRKRASYPVRDILA